MLTERVIVVKCSAPMSHFAGALGGALFPRAGFDLVAIAASAGGVAALKATLAQLAVPFSVPVAVVQHLPAFLPSQLSEVLGWRSRLVTRFARDGERLRAGTVFVAPPGRHLVIRGAPIRFELEDSPRLSYVRPAADRLFVTAAEQFGPRLLSVVLTGSGRDGAAGCTEVKRRGGLVIVQDPVSAQADAMPRAVLGATAVDLVLPLKAIPSALNSLCDVVGARELFCGSAAVSPILAA
jgi:two-component system, chemotaxis family, protein-glutamate methylesterase/glutaminase